jgi:predicted PurR-regulated permease PerM
MTIDIQVPNKATVYRSLAIGVGILIALYVCFVVREIWLPLILAFLLAMILDPVVDRMEAHHWTRPRASAFIFGSFLLIVSGLAVLAYPFLVAQVVLLQKGFEQKFPDTSHQGLIVAFRHMGLSPSIANASVSAVENAKTSFQHSSSWLTNFGMSFVSNAIWLVIMPIVAFYALRDFHIILAKSLLLVPESKRDLVQTGVNEITSVFGKYLRGLAIVSVLNGIATAVLLTVIRVPGGLVLGVIAGLLYSVPYIGALLTLALTGAVAFIGGGPNLLLLAVGLSTVLHQIIFDQIVSPRVLGGHVGLHPILSIIALLAGNLLLGIIGMVLAVPVAACIQIAVLSMIPKLSRQVQISSLEPDSKDTVTSLETETKSDHQKLDAPGGMHAAVTSAVASIEHGEHQPSTSDREKPKADI